MAHRLAPGNSLYQSMRCPRGISNCYRSNIFLLDNWTTAIVFVPRRSCRLRAIWSQCISSSISESEDRTKIGMSEVKTSNAIISLLLYTYILLSTSSIIINSEILCYWWKQWAEPTESNIVIRGIMSIGNRYEWHTNGSLHTVWYERLIRLMDGNAKCMNIRTQWSNVCMCIVLQIVCTTKLSFNGIHLVLYIVYLYYIRFVVDRLRKFESHTRAEF